jgi:hypothetical protein
VSIISEDGSVLLDDYVRPDSFIKNLKTHVSGIKPDHMRSALPFDEVRNRVLKVIEGKVVVSRPPQRLASFEAGTASYLGQRHPTAVQAVQPQLFRDSFS